MRGAVLFLALLALPIVAPAADALAFIGAGTGQASFTICFKFNHVVIAAAGYATDDASWTFVIVMQALDPQCQGNPVHIFTGPWSAASGGCGLTEAGSRLCISAPAGGTSSWALCSTFDVACDPDNTYLYGTMTAAGV